MKIEHTESRTEDVAVLDDILCNRCGKTYTPEEWDRLELKGYVGHWKSGGRLFAVELRQCAGAFGGWKDHREPTACQSTLGVECENPPMAGKEEVLET